MMEVTRRAAMTAAMLGGASASFQDEAQDDGLSQDQKFVMEAGFTREEAECWKKTAEAAGAFFQLPELHPSDRKEVEFAIHIVQQKLLGRPTYRKYIELAKRGRREG